MGNDVTPEIGLEVMGWELSICRLDCLPDASVLQQSPCFLGLTDDEVAAVLSGSTGDGPLPGRAADKTGERASAAGGRARKGGER